MALFRLRTIIYLPSSEFYQLVEPLFTSKIHKLAQKHHGPERAQGLSTRVSAAWRLVESLLSNNPASREATDVDERVRILNGCIIPRLERYGGLVSWKPIPGLIIDIYS